MRKVILIGLTLLFVLLMSVNILAYGVKYSSYDPLELRQKMSLYLPEGFNIGFIQVEKLDPTSGDEYVFLDAEKVEPGSTDVKQYVNKVFLFRPMGEDFQMIWSSELFSGYVELVDFGDTNNDGRLDINLTMSDDDSVTHYLRIFNWNGTTMDQVYPQEGLPALITDGNITISGLFPNIQMIFEDMVYETSTELTRYYYLFKDNRIELARKEVISLQEPTLEAEETPQSRYPLIATIVAQQAAGTLSGVTEISSEGLYLVEIEPATPDESRYLIVNQSNNSASLLYKLPKEYNSLRYRRADLLDLNGDGNTEICMVDTQTYTDEFDLYYILSLTTVGPRLISPVTDDLLPTGLYNTPMGTFFMFGPLSIEDIDQDGSVEIGTSVEYNDEECVQYWRWDNDIYVAYKIEYTDSETGETLYIDNSSLEYGSQDE